MTAQASSRASGRRRRSSFDDRLRTTPKGWALLAGALVGLAAWETAAQVIGRNGPQAAQVMPSLLTVATDGFVGLSNFFKGGFGIEATANGAETSALGAVLSLVTNGAITVLRVVVGLVAGSALGALLGFLVAGLRPLRYGVTGVAELMRMLPTLAMAPLFTLWFGATTAASIVFIIFGVMFIVFVAVTNAVRNIPPETIEYPRTLGVRGVRMYTRVIFPAVLPEVRGPLMFAGLVAWTSALASELYGIQSGLGWMLGETLKFSLVGQMVVIAIVYSALALGTMRAMSWGVGRATAWND
ncbi:ABC transporter permease subunit [Leucobacter allii]|uniref:ABC transporter permease subunit n=1 Tax=Leucobacter allii TaxID=2932247 RepID=A0ABY4FIE0_9MICO|nr:ABC transporter permease subunit [Leucobacter allii]UOQ56439.1 ABC transporter permease subunit [Leucobacter allii]UOR00873.1 ABC transporter permease subunit [Leucobacter allii]